MSVRFCLSLRRPTRLLLPAVLFGLLASAAQAEITLTLERKDGDKISDVAKIVAKVDGPDLIQKVEFRVDDELRYTDTSTPYVFEWDTIAEMEKEGEHTLTVTALDSEGNSKRATVKLVIDNELGLGATALAQKALEGLNAKDYTITSNYARRALKVEPGNVDASRALAGVQASRKNWDRAIAVLEKSTKLEESPAAMLDLAAYKIQRSLLPINAPKFYSDLKDIHDLRKKAGAFAVKEVQIKYKDEKDSTKAAEAVGDALLEAGRFGEAVSEYGKSALKENAPLSSVNRRALAYVLDDRSAEAVALLRPLIRAKKDDAATRSVLGLAHLRLREFEQALALVQKDVTDQVPSALIVAAYGNAVLGKKREAVAYAKDAVNLLPNAGDAHYADMMAQLGVKELVNADKELNTTLALAPFQTGPVLAYAARLALSQQTDRYTQALDITSFVLEREPENVNAKIMQAMLYLQTSQKPKAEQMLFDLNRKDNNLSADVKMAQAVYWEVQQNTKLSGQNMEQAIKMDARFTRQSPEPPMNYVNTLNRRLFYRAGFFLNLSTLYPNRGE